MILDVMKSLVPLPIKKVRRSFLRRKWARERAEHELIRKRFRAIMRPESDIAALIAERTCVSKLYAETDHGTFAFKAADRIIGWSIAALGAWEARQTSILLGLISEGDVVVDVGANIGWYSVQFARAAGESGQVISFEPEPANFALLEENLALNNMSDRVEALNLAAADKEGTLDFELSPTNFGDHRVRFEQPLNHPAGPEYYEESSRPVISVRSTRLDETLSAYGISPGRRIRLIKLDCQGAEAAIIAGARKTLAETEYLATEYWPYGIRRSGHDPREFLETIAATFDSFVELQANEGPPVFQPTTSLVANAAELPEGDGYLFYLFKKNNQSA
jgi:FkbM family methyltransferase